MVQKLLEKIVQQAGNALAREIDIDFVVLTSAFDISEYRYGCPREDCRKPYKTATWFSKHLRKTGHYVELPSATHVGQQAILSIAGQNKFQK